MPLRPEHAARYPRDWKAVSAYARDRAGWRCQGSPAYPECVAVNGLPHPVTASLVVLTVAHLDHQPENCDPANLRAWCQRCHLTYDAAFHAINARATRRKAIGCDDLFGGQP